MSFNNKFRAGGCAIACYLKKRRGAPLLNFDLAPVLLICFGIMEKGKKSLRKKRILLVDDDLDMRELVKATLDTNAHEIVEVNNAADAIVLIAYRRFDLVMTDYKMPLINGSELAVAIRQLVPSQPILMITGHPNALRPLNPVDAILRKPFSVEKLRATVARILSAPDNAGA